MAHSSDILETAWIDEAHLSFETFKSCVAQTTDTAMCPRASDITHNIPIYSGAEIEEMTSGHLNELMAEWTGIFGKGPGVLAIKGAIADPAIIDRATEVFETLIEEERGTGGGDHFAKPGANDRVWNAVQKHAQKDPEGFARYFSNRTIDLASRAWLGDGYQITAQVNRVNPGGAAQTPHRDYHLGFMPNARMAKFPAHVHHLSPALTLQGAVAHCDMPVETGPTMLLPFSQQFTEGYLAFNRPEFQAHFAQHHVQLPLAKGDMLFFNPALMHGAGTNITTDTQRMANLLQVGSAFGRSIETVDRTAMMLALYPCLQNAPFEPEEIDRILAASTEGYAFPTNLDRDPPVGSMNPQSQTDITKQALAQNMPLAEFTALMQAWENRRRA